MRVLDLFCGAGGAAMGLHRAWPHAEIIGVDIKPQRHYPFAFVQADAISYSLEGFDFIWASPPCQHHVKGLNSANRSRGRQVDHADFIAATRDRLCGIPFVMENVVSAPLVNPVQLCGSSFGLMVRRHRKFEASFPIVGSACNHPTEKKYPTNWRPNGKRTLATSVQIYGCCTGPLSLLQTAMDIDWMTRKELTQAIPPAYSEYIAKQYDAGGR